MIINDKQQKKRRHLRRLNSKKVDWLTFFNLLIDVSN